MAAIRHLNYDISLREKCPYLEFFCIFPHLDWIRRDAEYFSVFSLNVGKYGPEKFQIKTLNTDSFHAVFIEYES